MIVNLSLEHTAKITIKLGDGSMKMEQYSPADGSLAPVPAENARVAPMPTRPMRMLMAGVQQDTEVGIPHHVS